jgi:hypothetical protein
VLPHAPEGPKYLQQLANFLISAPPVNTLIFAITTLNLFMQLLLDFSLQDTGPRRFIEACSFQDMRRIDPIVMATAHYMFLEIRTKLEFIDGNLQKSATLAQDGWMQRATEHNWTQRRGILTLLYVAL